MKFKEGKDGVDYTALAARERQKYRNIAKHYFKSAPSILNLYNGISSFIKSLPIVGISASDVNPNVVALEGPTLPIKTTSSVLLLKSIYNGTLKIRTLSNAINKAVKNGVKVKKLSPTEKVFAALGKPVPKASSNRSGLFGATLLIRDNLRRLGVDEHLLSGEDINKLILLRKESIVSDLHLGNRRGVVNTNHDIELYDTFGDDFRRMQPIGSLRVDNMPITQQNNMTQYGPLKEIPYSKYLDENTRGVHMINNHTILNKNKELIRHGVSKDMYDILILDLKLTGDGFGFFSGINYRSPGKTLNVIRPNTKNVQFDKITPINDLPKTPRYKITKTYSDSGTWLSPSNEEVVGDVYLITDALTPTVPFKNSQMFNVNTIDDFGNFVVDWSRGSRYKNGKDAIYIKPSKRGTFTAAAKKHGKSVQQFASQVLANKGKYSPAMVKKANFAKNASKWNH